MELGPLPYQIRIVDYFRAHEPAVWQWYGSPQSQDQRAAASRLDLLKATIRLDASTHGDLYAAAERVSRALGLDAPTTFYQAIGRDGANASLFWLPEGAHIVISGDVLGSLAQAEIEALVAHELGHLKLWQESQGDFFRALRILGDMSDHPRAEPAVARSEMVFRQCCEIYADRAALVATDNMDAVIACLVKVATGLGVVSAAAYVQQADEIFGLERPTTQGLSHPETYLRARAISEWARGAELVDREVERMIAGPLHAERLDLLDQVRLERFTRDLLGVLFVPSWTRTEALIAHARLFFADFVPVQEPPDLDALATEIREADASILDYVAFVLLDFAAADPALTELPLAHALELAEGLGLRERLEEKASKELKITKKTLAMLREEGRALLARAAGAGGEGG